MSRKDGLNLAKEENYFALLNHLLSRPVKVSSEIKRTNESFPVAFIPVCNKMVQKVD